MNRQEFVNDLQEFTSDNGLELGLITPVGETDIIVHVSGKSAKILLVGWLNRLKQCKQILGYSEPEIDLEDSTYVTRVSYRKQTAGPYSYAVYSDEYSDEVICESLKEALRELQKLNRQTGVSWKLKILKEEV